MFVTTRDEGVIRITSFSSTLGSVSALTVSLILSFGGCAGISIELITIQVQPYGRRIEAPKRQATLRIVQNRDNLAVNVIIGEPPI